jgi:hypothetical protein
VDCPLIVAEEDNGLVVSKAANGFRTIYILGLVMFVLIAIGALALPFLVWSQVKPDERGSVVMISVLFCGLGIVGIWATLYEQTMRFVLVVTEEAIVVTRETCFGRSVKQWARGELRAIRTEASFPGNPETSVRVMLVKADGEEKLVAGKAHVCRYLATQLRRATGLSANPAMRNDER